MGLELKKWLSPDGRGKWLENNIREFSCFGQCLPGYKIVKIHKTKHLICILFIVHKSYLKKKKKKVKGEESLQEMIDKSLYWN